MTLLLFLGVALLVVMAGVRVAYYGDVLAERLGLGRAWMGLILVAATTSLPEVVVTLAAARLGPLTLRWATWWGATSLTL
ncbi:hypothetical protein [Thermus sp.]|uniref:hypothetical protein n=1 Tax=Thermus sp. TaxID=275 RepID=UPI00307CEFEC